jgi:hypothetical protein
MSQRWIPTGERSGLQTPIAATGSGSLCEGAETKSSCTDRSKSRWKNKTNEQQGRGSAPKKHFNLDQQSYELTTTYTTFAPQHLTSYIEDRPIVPDLIFVVCCFFDHF